MTQGFKKWKDSISTSPSTNHLGHYKTILVSDRYDNDQDHYLSNLHIIQTIITIINKTIETEIPLQRWPSSTVVMIEKSTKYP